MEEPLECKQLHSFNTSGAPTMSQLLQCATLSKKHLVSCPKGAHSQMRVIDGSKQYIPYSEITAVIAMTIGSYRIPLEGKSQQL